MKKRKLVTALAVFILTAAWLAAVPAARAAENAGKAPEGVFSLSKPNGLLDTTEGLYIMDGGNNAVYLLKDGKIEKIIGKQGVKDIYGFPEGGYEDASYNESYFAEPYDMEPFLGGYVISDTDNNVIRFAKDGKVYTAAGSQEAGYYDAKGVKARFHAPKGLASDGAGNLYIADCLNNVIRKMDKNGEVTTFAGSGEGYKDGEAANAAFCAPAGLDWYDGALYVADSGNHCIRKIENGMVTTVAGGANPYYENSVEKAGGYKDGPLTTALFDRPEGVLVRKGIIYVADSGNSAFRKIENYRVTTIDRLKTNEDRTYPAKPADLAFYEGSLYGTDCFTGILYTLAEKDWKTKNEQKVTALLAKPAPKSQTKELSLKENGTPALVRSLGKGTIALKPDQTGTVKIRVYTKTAKGIFTISSDKAKKKVLSKTDLEKAAYDKGMKAYYQEISVPVTKGKTLYLSASKGSYILDSQLYRSGSRSIKAAAVTKTAASSKNRSVYYKYVAPKTETVTVKQSFFDWNGKEKETAEITLCDSKKKAISKKVKTESDYLDSKNQISFKAKKGKTYYIKVNSSAAYALEVSK